MYEINAIGMNSTVTSPEEAASLFASIPTTRLPIVFAVEGDSRSIIAATGFQRRNGRLCRAKQLHGADAEFDGYARDRLREKPSVLAQLGKLFGLRSAHKPTA